MNCPQCKNKDVITIDSRPVSKGVRRRRKCEKCNHRWSTQEIPKSVFDFYEEQMKRLYALEQFQMASSTYKGGTGKARGTAWTKSETDRLITMYFDQHPLKEIAEALNRSYMSINKRLCYLRSHNKLKKVN
jgi:Zn ribbon nucleic-acid-binding protein